MNPRTNQAGCVAQGDSGHVHITGRLGTDAYKRVTLDRNVVQGDRDKFEAHSKYIFVLSTTLCHDHHDRKNK